ncbi:MAG: hypothetical protein ACREOO_16025 [bacterium]
MLSRTFLMLLAILFLNGIAAHACPGCASALNGDLGFGFNASILFMMAMPFTVVGCVAAGIVLLYRKTSQTQASPKRQQQNS